MILKFSVLLFFAVTANGFLFKRQKTVDELILDKYLGRWYEVYNSLIQRETSEKDAQCTTATYTLKPDNKTFSVYHSGRKGSPTGPEVSIRGTAVMTEPGRMIVQFPFAPKQTTPNYLVLKLGPATFGKEGLYEYAVIGYPWKLNSWILTRDLKTFHEKYEEEAVTFLKSREYWLPWNKPRPSIQSDKCIYPPK